MCRCVSSSPTASSSRYQGHPTEVRSIECPMPWTASIVESCVPMWAAFCLPVSRHRAHCVRGLSPDWGSGMPAMWLPVAGWMDGWAASWPRRRRRRRRRRRFSFHVYLYEVLLVVSRSAGKACGRGGPKAGCVGHCFWRKRSCALPFDVDGLLGAARQSDDWTSRGEVACPNGNRMDGSDKGESESGKLFFFSLCLLPAKPVVAFARSH